MSAVDSFMVMNVPPPHYTNIFNCWIWKKGVREYTITHWRRWEERSALSHLLMQTVCQALCSNPKLILQFERSVITKLLDQQNTGCICIFNWLYHVKSNGNMFLFKELVSSLLKIEAVKHFSGHVSSQTKLYWASKEGVRWSNSFYSLMQPFDKIWNEKSACVFTKYS